MSKEREQDIIASLDNIIEELRYPPELPDADVDVWRTDLASRLVSLARELDG